MKTKGRQECRLAVGTSDGRRSTIWKIWVQKSDSYIQSRMMGSDTKVSMHADGRCQWSRTSEWVQRQSSYKNADRHFKRWRLSSSKRGEAIHAFRIIIPESELRETRMNEKLQKVHWLPLPSQGSAIIVEFHFTPISKDMPLTIYLPYHHLFSFRLGDGRWLVAFYHEESMNLENLNTLKRLRAQFNNIELEPQFRACGFVEHPNGSKGLIELVPFANSHFSEEKFFSKSQDFLKRKQPCS